VANIHQTEIKMSPDYLRKFQTDIGRMVEVVLKDGRFGMCSGVLRVLDPMHGNGKFLEGDCCDRFKLSVPYAGLTVQWEVIFNADYPEMAPDFIFGFEDTEFMPDLVNLPSLVDWDHEDSSALLNVLLELYAEYKKYHESIVVKHTRLQIEYCGLVDPDVGYKANQIEVHVSQKSPLKVGPVNFLVSLDVDFGRIPAYLTKDNPGEDSAVLLASFPSPDSGRVSPQLFLSPRVEKALGGSAALRIPAFHGDGSLMDYVPNVCELLKNKVDQVVQSYESRQEYISAFLSNFGRSVIEYDCEAFNNISFMFSWHDFFFSVFVTLSGQHPEEKPTFTFQSVYHEDGSGKPYEKVITDYPYSPRWKGTEMAERARQFILGKVSDFQKGSVTEGSYR